MVQVVVHKFSNRPDIVGHHAPVSSGWVVWRLVGCRGWLREWPQLWRWARGGNTVAAPSWSTRELVSPWLFGVAGSWLLRGGLQETRTLLNKHSPSSCDISCGCVRVCVCLRVLVCVCVWSHTRLNYVMDDDSDHHTHSTLVTAIVDPCVAKWVVSEKQNFLTVSSKWPRNVN